MAHHRPPEKKLRRLRKLIERTPLPAYIDLVDWLQTRGHAKSAKEARELLIDGKVRVESHPVGRQRMAVQKPLSAIETLRGVEQGDPELEWVVQQFVPASTRDRLAVV